MNCSVTLNDEKNGIEVRFDEKPDASVLEMLKENGFRWSRRQNMWFAKQSEERLNVVKNFYSPTNNTKQVEVSNVYKADILDLFTLTRTDLIPEHKEKCLSCKEIATIIRKHLKTTFPMFKFSVTSKYDAVYAEITGSPYDKESEEVEAMLGYMGAYIESWKPNSQYHDFYGGKGYPYVSYDCEYRDMTVSEMNISELFKERKAEWEKEEEIKKEAAYQEYLKKQEENEKRWKAAKEIRDKEVAHVEEHVSIIETEPFFVLNVLFNSSKLNTTEEYQELDAEHADRIACEVNKKVFMDAETYKMFTKNLLCDWTFVAKTGGSGTKDVRVNSMDDYNNMSEAERKTVEWYNCNCVAIYCDNVLKLVVDAQGYDYCRYVGFVDDASKIGEYDIEQPITEKEYEEIKIKAGTIEDASTEIVCDND